MLQARSPRIEIEILDMRNCPAKGLEIHVCPYTEGFVFVLCPEVNTQYVVEKVLRHYLTACMTSDLQSHLWHVFWQLAPLSDTLYTYIHTNVFIYVCMSFYICISGYCIYIYISM